MSMVYNATLSYIVAISFIGWGNQKNQRKPPTCRKLLQQTLSHNDVSGTPRVNGIRTHNFSGYRHWWHG